MGDFAGAYALDAARGEIRDKDRKGVLEAVFDKIAGWFFVGREVEKLVVSQIKRGTYTGQDVEVPIQRFFNEGISSIANLSRGLFSNNSKRSREKDIRNGIDSGIDFLMMWIGAPYMLKRTMKKGKEILDD